MPSRAELVETKRSAMVAELGEWAEDPRSLAAVEARAARTAETFAHMDHQLPQEAKASSVQVKAVETGAVFQA